jgi:ribosomal protein S18 acetylase RimI-like enzyme
MSASADLRFRAAAAQDVQAIVGLHADSWRRHYRGAYSDAFLDGDVTRYLVEMWATRLASPDPRASTILAEAGGAVVGIVHALLGEDPRWGSLLDNLHVAYGLKRSGIGTRLMALTARAVLDWSPASGLYLWVLEKNVAAQAFYEARGGACVERAEDPPPGGDPANLNGQPMMLRYAWQDPSRLLDS